MAVGHGKNAKVFINGYNLTSYFDRFDCNLTADVAETTTFGDTSKTYLAGKRDGDLSLEGLYDGASSAVDQVLVTAIASAYTNISVYPQNDTVGNVGVGLAAIESNYTTRETLDGAVRISAAFKSNVAVERLTSIFSATQTNTNTSSTGFNYTSTTTCGGSAYLHVTEITNSSATITVEHSSNNSTWATLATFTALTSAATITSQRVEITAGTTIYPYTRVAYAGITGTITFQVGLYRALF